MTGECGFSAASIRHGFVAADARRVCQRRKIPRESAAVSLLVWTGVITLGRAMGYERREPPEVDFELEWAGVEGEEVVITAQASVLFSSVMGRGFWRLSSGADGCKPTQA